MTIIDKSFTNEKKEKRRKEISIPCEKLSTDIFFVHGGNDMHKWNNFLLFNFWRLYLINPRLVFPGVG